MRSQGSELTDVRSVRTSHTKQLKVLGRGLCNKDDTQGIVHVAAGAGHIAYPETSTLRNERLQVGKPYRLGEPRGKGVPHLLIVSYNERRKVASTT